MIDIHFYMKIFELKKRIMNNESFTREFLAEAIEDCRRLEPVIYNIETTNACNMHCVMCPRTTMMTRRVETLDLSTFTRIADQIRPWTENEWSVWQGFVETEYGIGRTEMSENHFFLHVIPDVVVMHGYGDPLLDSNIAERVKVLVDRGLKPYFSCNPANINENKVEEMFSHGLEYIKFSVESVDDFLHKEIRGDASNFSGSYNKIIRLLEAKKKYGYRTTIVITMLDLKRNHQGEEFEKLQHAFKDHDVYIYFKSQDQQWYQEKNEGTKSIHWLEFCQFPWSSMTIKSNGEVVMCVEDFNNEIVLGDAKTESLYDIWNGSRYQKFRQQHFKSAVGLKCDKQCDMNLVGTYGLFCNRL